MKNFFSFPSPKSKSTVSWKDVRKSRSRNRSSSCDEKGLNEVVSDDSVFYSDGPSISDDPDDHKDPPAKETVRKPKKQSSQKAENSLKTKIASTKSLPIRLKRGISKSSKKESRGRARIPPPVIVIEDIDGNDNLGLNSKCCVQYAKENVDCCIQNLSHEEKILMASDEQAIFHRCARRRVTSSPGAMKPMHCIDGNRKNKGGDEEGSSWTAGCTHECLRRSKSVDEILVTKGRIGSSYRKFSNSSSSDSSSSSSSLSGGKFARYIEINGVEYKVPSNVPKHASPDISPPPPLPPKQKHLQKKDGIVKKVEEEQEPNKGLTKDSPSLVNSKLPPPDEALYGNTFSFIVDTKDSFDILETKMPGTDPACFEISTTEGSLDREKNEIRSSRDRNEFIYENISIVMKPNLDKTQEDLHRAAENYAQPNVTLMKNESKDSEVITNEALYASMENPFVPNKQMNALGFTTDYERELIYLENQLMFPRANVMRKTSNYSTVRNLKDLIRGSSDLIRGSSDLVRGSSDLISGSNDLVKDNSDMRSPEMHNGNIKPKQQPRIKTEPSIRYERICGLKRDENVRESSPVYANIGISEMYLAKKNNDDPIYINDI